MGGVLNLMSRNVLLLEDNRNFLLWNTVWAGEIGQCIDDLMYNILASHAEKYNNSISPLDGRYATKLIELEQYFNEFALIKNKLLLKSIGLFYVSY